MSEIILGIGKGITQKVIPEKHTTNLERNLGENFTYYREHKRFVGPEPMWRYSGVVTHSLRYIYLSACVASDAN